MKICERVCLYIPSLILLSLTSTAFGGGYSVRLNYAMPPPPRSGSAADRQDFEILHRFQTNRTREECAVADAQSYMSIESFFGPHTRLLTAREMQAVQSLYHEIQQTADHEAKPYKVHFARPRPYNVDATLKPCISMPKGNMAYPSAHATAGALIGTILADLFPNRASALKAQGLQIGTNRVLGGVHHPSDIEAGETLALKIYEALQRNSDFLGDFQRVRKQLPQPLRGRRFSR